MQITKWLILIPQKCMTFYHDEKQCYKLRYFGDLGPDAGQAFLIGGPGGHACMS